MPSFQNNSDLFVPIDVGVDPDCVAFVVVMDVDVKRTWLLCVALHFLEDLSAGAAEVVRLLIFVSPLFAFRERVSRGQRGFGSVHLTGTRFTMTAKQEFRYAKSNYQVPLKKSSSHLFQCVSRCVSSLNHCHPCRVGWSESMPMRLAEALPVSINK